LVRAQENRSVAPGLGGRARGGGAVAVGPAKNSGDPFLRFRVTDLEGKGYLNQYVLVQWVADVSLLSNPAARRYDNAWPYDAPGEALPIESATAVPAYLYVPDESWDVLATYRILWYRLSYGPTPAPSAQWKAYAPGQLLINHPPTASAGAP